jgi:hypothetical protein
MKVTKDIQNIKRDFFPAVMLYLNFVFIVFYNCFHQSTVCAILTGQFNVCTVAGFLRLMPLGVPTKIAPLISTLWN